MLLTTVTTTGFLGDRSVPGGASPPLPGLIVSYENERDPRVGKRRPRRRNFTRRSVTFVRKFHDGHGWYLCESTAVNFHDTVNHAGDKRASTNNSFPPEPVRGLIERLWDELIIHFVERAAQAKDLPRSDPSWHKLAEVQYISYLRANEPMDVVVVSNSDE